MTRNNKRAPEEGVTRPLPSSLIRAWGKHAAIPKRIRPKSQTADSIFASDISVPQWQPACVAIVLVVTTDPAAPNPTLAIGGVIESDQIPLPKENWTPRLATLYPTLIETVVNGPESC